MATRWLQVPTSIATLIFMIPVCVFLSANQKLRTARQVERYHHMMAQTAYDRAGAILIEEHRQLSQKDSH